MGGGGGGGGGGGQGGMLKGENDRKVNMLGEKVGQLLEGVKGFKPMMDESTVSF